jgi:hypothetical protein
MHACLRAEEILSTLFELRPPLQNLLIAPRRLSCVKIRFFPDQPFDIRTDWNARVDRFRVDLFALLSWVVDCAFADNFILKRGDLARVRLTIMALVK